jgi:SPP1 family predicted phage head-tail adaptor
MARLKQFDIGTSQCVVIEKWTQTKDARGNNTDVFVQQFTAYANVDNLSSLRVFDNGQLKQADTFEMIVRKKQLDGRDINVLWKVKYQGKRHAVVNKVCLNKATSDFLLVVISKAQ